MSRRRGRPPAGRRRAGQSVEAVYKPPFVLLSVCKRMSLHEARAVCLGRPPPVSVPLVELVEVCCGGGGGRPPAGGARGRMGGSVSRQLGYEALRMRDARCGACQ